MNQVSHAGRRRALSWMARAAAGLPFAASAAAAAAPSDRLKPTAAVTVGPFYPPDPTGLPFFTARPLSPLPEGNDLTTGPGGRRAEGEHVRISGRVLNTAGQPIAGAKVEIWQVDARGHYVVETGADRDPGFTGYGTQVSDGLGRYAFTTIRPQGYGRYGGLIKRAAHIHMRVSTAGRPPLATEVWFAGAPGNDRDTFVSRIGDAELRDRMLVRLAPGANGIQAGVFDVVLPDA
jgi:protocatechuate 3,4-dioxygenase beta subunit